MGRIMVVLVVLCLALPARAQSMRAEQRQIFPDGDRAIQQNSFRDIAEDAKSVLDTLEIWSAERDPQFPVQRAFAMSVNASVSPARDRPLLTTRVRTFRYHATESAGDFWNEHPKEIALAAVILLVVVLIL